MRIKILLADDHKIIRHGLRSLLDRQSRIEVVGEAENGRQAVLLARDLQPDVVVMDISMPDLNGMDATLQILAESPHIKIIALSMHTDKRFIIRMLKADASGYLLKDCAFDELARAVTTVIGGQTYLSPEIATVVIKDLVQESDNSDSSTLALLSGREREVLQLISEGKTTKQIAGKLYISTKTVETHRAKIMKKLNIFSLAGLIKFAVREGLTSL